MGARTWGLAVALATAAAAPVQAEWLQATSRHFVIYADTDRATLQRRAVSLERFDAALRRTFQNNDADAEHNRVTVFVLDSISAVQRLHGGAGVAGFYQPRITGAVAFTPAGNSWEGEMYRIAPRAILFHEYAHHFMYSNLGQAYPAWFSEGFAEYAGTAREQEGALWLGAAASHRADGLYSRDQLPLRELFQPPERMTQDKLDQLYGRGWLLTHYLFNTAGGKAQLGRYITAFSAGKPSVEAATESFGDLRQLDAALARHLAQRRLPATRFELAQLGEPTVAIRPLTDGERALIGLRMRSTRGVDDKAAGPLYLQAKAAAAPHARDAVVQGWLAEMAFDAGKQDEAEAVADAALLVDPRQSQALLYKARVRMARAKTPAAWREARSWIVRANQANANDAAALALYYQSFGMEGVAPTKAAVEALYRAVEIVPEDKGVRFLAARELVLENDTPAAKRLLRAIASDPHVGTNNPAQRLLAALDAGQSGQAAVDALAAASRAEGKKE